MRLRRQAGTWLSYVGTLVQRGWTKRGGDETDHRACVLSITGVGATLADTVERRDRTTSVAAGLAQLPPADAALRVDFRGKCCLLGI